MIGACLAIAVLVGQVPASDPTALVAQLGAARYAQREAAASALERLGRSALPALQSVRDVKDLPGSFGQGQDAARPGIVRLCHRITVCDACPGGHRAAAMPGFIGA